MSDAQLEAAHTKLKSLRERNDLKLRPTKHLKTTFTDFDGREKPLKVRYYQVQGILHLVLMKRFLLGDDTGIGKCCGYNTYVNTDEGLVRIGDIEDWSEMEPDTFRSMGRTVNVLIGNRCVPIKNFYYGGVKPTITMTTRYGFKNTGSHVHPMLVLREGKHQWVQARDLEEGDFLCVERREAPFPANEPALAPSGPLGHMTPDLARFLGYYIGEGSLTARGQVRLSQCPLKNPEIHANIIQLIEGLFGRSPDHPNQVDLYLNDTRLRRWLVANGLGYTRSAGREVPSCILQATRESSAEFLRALFEGEGHVSKTHIEYSTASEELGCQVQIMLLRFGVVARRSPKRVEGRDHIYWRLTICGEDAQQFQAQIGFISTRKRDALTACLARPRNTNHDVVPGLQWIFEQVRSDLLDATTRSGANDVRVGSGLKQFGVSLVNTLNNIRNYGRNPSYTFIEKVVVLLEARNPEAVFLPLLRAFLDTRYFYDPIVSLDSGEEEVFDIEVDDPDHSFVGNGLVNHNTLETIGALCYIWEKEPDRKVIVLTTKSAAKQWVREFAKFTTGVRVILCKGTPSQRESAYRLWNSSKGPTVMVMGYRSAVQDFTKMQKWAGYIFVADEITAVKNPRTQVHQVCAHLASQADRTWGLTATLIKNNLMEGYGIYQVVMPGLFGMSHNQFMLYYCLTRMQRLPKSNRQVPVIVGYLPQKIREFREIIDPYFIGRPKHQVASELPTLTSQVITVEMSEAEEDKYAEALSGLLELGADEETGESVVKETTKLTQIAYCQEIVNHLGLIDCEGRSAKLETLIDLLTEGDFAEEKIIIFTRFRKMVDILMPVLKKNKIKAVRVTGSENEDQRDQAMKEFQNPDSDVRVCCITTAGSESINLQAAKALICYDTPWSAGDFLQLIGRMIRIGSTHDKCYVIHLISRGKRRRTVDHRVMEVLSKKMTLVEAVLGKRIKGEGDTEAMIEVENDISDLFNALREDAREAAGAR